MELPQDLEHYDLGLLPALVVGGAYLEGQLPSDDIAYPVVVVKAVMALEVALVSYVHADGEDELRELPHIESLDQLVVEDNATNYLCELDY